MDDYVIGIRLALDNGVSAGLASIRADLTALDQSVAASAEGLKALSQSVSQAPLPARLPPPRPVPAAPNTVADQPEASHSPIPTASPAAADASRPPVVRIDPPSAPTVIMPQSMPAALSPNRTEKSNSLSPAAPVTMNSPALQPPSRPSSPTPPLASGTMAPQGPNPATSAPIFQPDAAPPPSRAPLHSATPYAPPPAQTSSGPTGGNVFLDGERVGHWLASHLAREANRPSYGGADFDPSLSIAWPGASQGGQ